ncbi:hypothetical protein SD71_01140 [Cohnella kolymensis]|uniref:Uncharacterized protein n=2 Tax=Cohnella kolymensis TaxID=1590652 RepID=A0ABR5A9G4_9BACL|nr:hypothetical protein SD71_01140 [Cohnella kolymensis]
MEDNNKPGTEEQPVLKKVSLADAMKAMLEKKKQAQKQGGARQDHFSTDTKKMKSQIKKKPNNQKKRTGV